MTDEARRYNDFHAPAGSSTGGQFASGHGSGGGSKKPAGHPGHGGHPAAKPTDHANKSGPMSYDPTTKTGAGYGMPHGDPRVHDLQRALNRLGLTDAHGQPLKPDGKLGPKTTHAIEAAQRRLGMKADGVVTPGLLAQLIAAKSLPAGHTSGHAAGHAGGHGAAVTKPAVKPAARADTTPYGDVEYADPGYQADGKKRYPIDTEEHCKAAWSYINQADNASKYSAEQLSNIKGRIMTAGKKYGITFDSGRSDSMVPFYRSYPIEDVSVRSGRDGRIVEAYAAVFNTPAEIHDQDGHYLEELAPEVFNRAISDARPQGGRQTWRIGVFYNHGMTIMGTPSDRHSMPVGVPVDVKADRRGLWTATKYHQSQFCDEIVEGLESGAIPGYSFSGQFRRSDPLIPRGGFRPGRDGSLRTVRRTESTLREYGPTPFPAYKDAAILGVRAEQLLSALAADPEMAMRMIGALRAGAPEGDSPALSSAPTWDSLPEDSHQVRSGRSVKEELAAARSAFLQKYGSEHV